MDSDWPFSARKLFRFFSAPFFCFKYFWCAILTIYEVLILPEVFSSQLIDEIMSEASSTPGLSAPGDPSYYGVNPFFP